MTLDALRLEVPDIREEGVESLADLHQRLAEARRQPHEHGLQQALSLLFSLNRSAMTLLERQRALQSFTEEYLHYARHASQAAPSSLEVRLCAELAAGFKRLLLQILQSKHPSRPHLAWCLYMAQHFLAQTLLHHYQLYQEPPAGLWRDSHLLYWIGERQECLDEPIAAPFQPQAAATLRGLYQQILLLALSNPFHLAEGEALLLFRALAPLAGLARLCSWDEECIDEGPTVDLAKAQPFVPLDRQPDGADEVLRRFELGPLLIALHDPAPLQTPQEFQLLERVRQHWLHRQQRRHERTDQYGEYLLVIGLADIHAQLLNQHPGHSHAQVLDVSPGGARLLCSVGQAERLPVGQLLLLLGNTTPVLAVIRWRHINEAGLHLGIRYMKGLARPVWLRRAPNAPTHAGILQSTPAPGGDWHHGLWLPQGKFVDGENLWLQMLNAHNQAIVPLSSANLSTPLVTRYPLKLA